MRKSSGWDSSSTSYEAVELIRKQNIQRYNNILNCCIFFFDEYHFFDERTKIVDECQKLLDKRIEKLLTNYEGG